MPSLRILVLACAGLMIAISTGEARDVHREVATPTPRETSSNLTRVLPLPTGLTSAFGDTFYLYGGPGSDEGRFETPEGAPDWQDWVSVDAGKVPEFWHLSTFNAANLNGHGAGNTAMWCGQSAEQQPGWATAPGYGNEWNTELIWSSGPIADPSVGQTIGLDFVFNIETETAYDPLRVEYEKNGFWNTVLYWDWTNKEPSGVFPSPGLRFGDLNASPLVYDGNDYGGESGDEIRIRLHFSSDGAWSDEDGLFPTDAGAVQVDDISVTYEDGGPTPVVDVTDFEGLGPFTWTTQRLLIFGDFAKLYSNLTDIDPCRLNRTTQATFVDDGTEPHNFDEVGGVWPGTGSTSPTWSYGTPDGWVIPRASAMDPEDRSALDNEVWTPPILWDLPGPGDDGVARALIRFDVFNHLPAENCVFYTVRTRASSDGGASWHGWSGKYRANGSNAAYETVELSFGVNPASYVTHFQVALGVEDQRHDGEGTCSLDATPAPWFDNVAFIKVIPRSPSIVIQPGLIFQDTFPPSGLVDFDSDPGALYCRFDAARDIGVSSIVPGDSLVAKIRAESPGSEINVLNIRWILDLNPLFAGIRYLYPLFTVIPGGAANGWDQVTSFSSGSLVVAHQDLFAFDLPFEGDSSETMFFPGDVCRYYLQAGNTDGYVITVPADTTGFSDGLGYDPRFTIRALPSLRDDGQGGTTQPEVLLVDASGDPNATSVYVQSMLQNGWRAGEEYDLFVIPDPAERFSHGIGSAGGHGATPEQLQGYSCVLYVSGDQRQLVLSDGSNTTANDKSDDLGLLTQWHDQAGFRLMAAFGDHFVSATHDASAAGQAYVQDVMGVTYRDADIRDEIDGQLAPAVLPRLAVFAEEFVAYGSCPRPRSFDSLAPFGGAVVGHGFEVLMAPASAYPTPVASVVHDRLVLADRKVDVTFPFDLARVWNRNHPNPGGSTDGAASRAKLLHEILIDLGGAHPGLCCNPPVAAGSSPTPAIVGLRAAPNPFNPRTTIRFSAGRRASYRVQIYDVRGRLVAEPHRGPLAAGPHVIRWDGTDLGGANVASGAYVVRVTGDGQIATIKTLLLR